MVRMQNKKQEQGDVNLASMDDEEIYGEILFHRVCWAMRMMILTDYKVVVLMMDEQLVSDRVQQQFHRRRGIGT